MLFLKYLINELYMFVAVVEQNYCLTKQRNTQ